MKVLKGFWSLLEVLVMNMNASFVIVSVLLMLTRCVLVILMVEFIIIIIIFEIHIYKFIVRKSLLLHILFHLKKKKKK